MTDNKVSKYNIWREPIFQEIWKNPENGDWTGAKKNELKSSSNFLNWLDERDGERDNIITSSGSTCISEDDLWKKISEIKTTHDRQKEILNGVTKYLPTCEMYLEKHEIARRKSPFGTSLTNSERIALGIYKGPAIRSHHKAKAGFISVPVVML